MHPTSSRARSFLSMAAIRSGKRGAGTAGMRRRPAGSCLARRGANQADIRGEGEVTRARCPAATAERRRLRVADLASPAVKRGGRDRRTRVGDRLGRLSREVVWSTAGASSASAARPATVLERVGEFGSVTIWRSWRRRASRALPTARRPGPGRQASCPRWRRSPRRMSTRRRSYSPGSPGGAFHHPARPGPDRACHLALH
jgi:hypothetical protein